MKKDLANSKQETSNNRPVQNEGFKIGREIKAAKVRVIGVTGQNLGILDLDAAIDQAAEQSLELVQIGFNEQEGCPTTKIMDFGKFLYERKKQRNEAKKNQKVIEVKELKFRPNIGDGDYTFRVNRIVEFLEEGKHVKITLQFKGRELQAKDALGGALFDRIFNDVKSKFGIGFEVQKESKGGAFWSKNFVPKAT